MATDAIAIPVRLLVEVVSFTEKIHSCPPDGSDVMPCCGKTLFEAMKDRMTLDASRVTCESGVDTEYTYALQEHAYILQVEGEPKERQLSEEEVKARAIR